MVSQTMAEGILQPSSLTGKPSKDAASARFDLNVQCDTTSRASAFQSDMCRAPATCSFRSTTPTHTTLFGSPAILPRLCWAQTGWGQHAEAGDYRARVREVQAATAAEVRPIIAFHVHRLCASQRIRNKTIRQLRQANFNGALERALRRVRSATLHWLCAQMPEASNVTLARKQRVCSALVSSARLPKSTWISHSL